MSMPRRIYDPARERYSRVAMILHWLIAALVLTNMSLAWRFLGLKPEGALPLIQIHKSIGIFILLLTLVRLGWRLRNPPPAQADHLKPWEKRLSLAVHRTFYAYLLLAPLSGWLAASTSTHYPIVLFGSIHWPMIGILHALPLDEKLAWMKRLMTVHRLLSYVGYTLIVLHVSAALKHQFFDRTPFIGRMLPSFGRLQKSQGL